jgi:hypothetical protein
VVSQAPRGGLTSVEQSLVDHVGWGEWLDLAADDGVIDEASMRSWGDSRTCRATVISDILRGRLAPDPDLHGLRLRGARISGRLDLANHTTEVNFELRDCFLEEGILARDAHLATVVLTGCRLEHRADSPLDADRLTCSVLDLREATIIGHGGAGAVSLLGADVGQLDCTKATLGNDSGAALDAEGLQVDQAVFLRGGFTATGAGELGAVRLLGAHIGGQFDCMGAHMGNDSGAALVADRLQVGQSMYLAGRFTGAGEAGAVRLAGAHIGGQLSCTGAYLGNHTGPALAADGLQVHQAVLLRGGFTATGAGELGAVRLLGAHIGGQLSCNGAHMGNDSGPALVAEGLQVGQNMFLRGGFTATGAGELGAVRLAGAHIGGQLECNGATLGNDSGPALSAPSLQVGLDIFLIGLTATGAGDYVAVDLTGTRLGGALRFDSAQLEHATDSHARLAVDGLTYAGVPQGISARGWLDLLRDGTRGYAAQPYQQLAAGYRALGDERQAREILMAQRDDELARTDPCWSERLWGRITKVALGYGYQPWRALLFLAAVVVLSCVIAVVLGSHGALAQTGKAATPGKPCTVVQQVSVGLDLNLPVGTSLARADCDLTRDSASAAAAWLTAAGWALRLLAWVFAALFIAGFTSAVRKT